MKYKKPVVWLDTNFVITMVHNKDPRIKNLLEFLKQKRGEYFLVEGDDTELKMGNGEVSEYARLLSQLSSGVSFLPYEVIEQFQFQKVARALIEGRKDVVLQASDFIKGDPVDTHARVQEAGFVVDARFNVPSLRKMDEESKRSIYERLEANRPKGTPISEQQRLEAATPAEIFRSLLLKMVEMKKAGETLPPSIEDIFETSERRNDNFASNFRFVSDRIQWWRVVGGARDLADALKETYEFVQSESFKKMPFNEINSILWGDIYAGNEALKKSDYWDVKHMSALLPFAQIIFTEKRMRLRLHQYKLDQKYKAEVYSIQNLEDFFKLHV